MNTLMKFDPATGDAKPYPSHAEQWRAFHVAAAWLFCPWSGQRRNALDVGMDPFGLLTLPAGQPLSAAKSFLPAIGEPLNGGLYAGIARAEDGMPEAPLILLPDRPTGKLNWADAKAWAEGLGNGARLPTRSEASLIYTNLREQIEDKSDWYWTCTPTSDGYVWVQGFNRGFQNGVHENDESLACAVRWIPVNPSTP